MKSPRILGTLGAAALLFGAALAAPVRAQVDLSKPIVVKQKDVKPKRVKFRGYVMNATTAQITVRDRKNDLAIRTFAYSPAARERMLAVIEQGGYQYGDKVEIEHEPGSDVALKIKGKPSRAL